MKKQRNYKKKKAPKPYDYKYGEYDFEKLKIVPTINFIARNNNLKNSGEIKGTIPIDFSFYKIKELIEEKHKYSCKNLRLYMLEGQEKKYFDNILYRTFKDLEIVTDTLTIYYEFEPFCHPTLEGSISG